MLHCVDDYFSYFVVVECLGCVTMVYNECYVMCAVNRKTA